MKLFHSGAWHDRAEKINVTNPFDGSLVDTVPRATADDVDQAIAGAVAGAQIMRKLPGYERFKILRKAADHDESNFVQNLAQQDLARLGKSDAAK